MTRTRSSRGRRRNRDRTATPDEQTTGTVEAVRDAPPATPAADTTPSNELHAAPNERRRRRHRGQRQGRTDPPQEQRGAERPSDALDASERHARPAGGSPERRARPAADGADRRSRPAPDHEERRGRHSGEGRDDQGRRQNRRRPARRPTIMPALGDIFKPGVGAVTATPAESVKRPSVPVDNDGHPALGCPMLTRTRVGMPTAGGAHVPRCALAWALHSEEEAAYCMETPQVAMCWKVHPERVAEIDENHASRAAD